MQKILTALFMLLSCQTFCQVQEFHLKNGLKILVKEDHRAPTAVVMVWYHVGSADEPQGITGVSHAIEHMMFKGTPLYPSGVFTQTIAAKGGQDNAFTNTDYTAYFEQIDAKHLPTSFKLEADRMTHLLLSPEEFAQEIKVIQEERRLRTDNNPQALAFERFMAFAHVSAPYHHPVIGWMNDLQQMNTEDLKAWYQRYYAPNNATLVVVGDVDPTEVHALAQRYFGPITKHAHIIRKEEKEPITLGKKSIVIRSLAKMPLYMMGFTVPSVKTAKHKWEPYALELIASILDAGEGARFATNLVRGRHIASGADAYYTLYARYQTQFIVYGAPTQKTSMADLKKALQGEIAALKKTPVGERELQKIKNQIIAQKTFEQDSIFSQASELGQLESIGLGWRLSNQYIEEINQITPKQIQEVAQRYFQEDNMTEAELKLMNTKERAS